MRVDFATDLQDSDIPKVQDLGDQVSAIPALLYEFLRPNWSEGPFDATTKVGGCSRNPTVQDRGEGCPMADPAMREAVAFAIDKNEINSRLLGGTVQVANTNISPGAWFFADQTPATFDPTQAQSILEDAGWVDSDGDGIREKDGLKAKIELCTTTRQVRIDTLALISRLAEGRRHRGRHERGRRDGDLRRLQRGHRGHPVRPLGQQLRPRRARVLELDRPARQLLQLPLEPVRAGWRERRSGGQHRHRRLA